MSHSPDATLMIFSIACYAVSALALITYFFSRDTFVRNAGAALAIAGCAAQFVQFFVRYELTGIWPFLNLYGSLSLFAAMGVLIFIIFAFRYNLWFAGGFVVAIAAVFLAYGVTWNEGTLPPVPSLQSYWAKIHVPLVVSAYGAFLVSFVLSALYLVRYYLERGLQQPRRPMASAVASAAVDPGVNLSPSYYAAELALEDAGVIGSVRDPDAVLSTAAVAGNPVASWLNSLPSLAQLDVLTYRVVAVGLPLLTLGIITGAMWAREAWGAYWQWDPKETAALFSWIIYAIYMHLHTRNAWRGLRTSWVSVIGFASIIFCYLGVNIWISGLHSYKM